MLPLISLLQKLSYSIVVSTLALVVSVGGLWISYYKLNREGVPPEVFWNLKSIEVRPIALNKSDLEVASETVLEIDGELEISVSNRSSVPVFIVSCKIAGEGVHVGAGGYGERLYDCLVKDEIGLEKIEPGQTVFISIKFREDVSLYDVHGITYYRGWDGKLLDKVIREGNTCRISFSLTAGGGGWGQSCGLFRGSERLYSILLQTGSGEIIRKTVTVTGTPQWPWGRLERYVSGDWENSQ
ncbi:hypothetical protein [Aliiroseovarius sp. F47248L]|uniref:hypothetical protein n=1 Tax=Aliiroseovarius sp. F47248L TaxID=2926420 RepID=UPI001FF1E2D0|nr:hypothetical protein [Aliiroseovarius sp. F47248L]MCK0137625.1 hypothetical protein [Aliiroseovarius sp. F47248L]